MGFNEKPVLIKVTFILSIVGLLLDLIGFVTEYWSKYGYSHSGLWSYSGYTNLPSWFEATQAFETLGFIAAIVALVLIVLYVFVPQTSGKKIVFILAMLACFAAAGCIILGIIIYGSKMDNLSWSFALCCIAGIIFGISGILLVVDMLKR
ncbi:uncharacterized protein LOC132716451 isoform X7 [Ruditapes philippinarum]|uniref:uncharacterized protein LOC132716451 isoform X7 n=1 Tax=Ruditapes philippinarum TaxID=129788 RepID=UPI00295B5EE1|nr:uncharacterized protein LOC132716451 isoform X7 [Ruditapes philippinarum]XP_060555720.1 uncharacterized protein LOC132716451 isoform X7 [Ruditapes philippinarum]